MHELLGQVISLTRRLSTAEPTTIKKTRHPLTSREVSHVKSLTKCGKSNTARPSFRGPNVPGLISRCKDMATSHPNRCIPK